MGKILDMLAKENSQKLYTNWLKEYIDFIEAD